MEKKIFDKKAAKKNRRRSKKEPINNGKGNSFGDSNMISATVAHELRNPLGVIKIANYNIKRKNNNPELFSHIENIEKKIQEAEAIIKNILSLFTIKSPQKKKACILSVLEECMDELNGRYSGWNVEVEIRCFCRKRVEFLFDSIQMREVFTNIIENAYQSFNRKKGKLYIDINHDQKEKEVSIRFNDTGKGMEEGELGKIFKPFYTKKEKGVGLGLTLCKEIVRLHGGNIKIKSKKGNGTSVFVVLPVR